MRRTKKTLSLILVMAMVLTLFAGVAQAQVDLRVGSPGGRIETGVQSVGDISITAPANEWVLGANEFAEFRIRLPLEFEWVADPRLENLRIVDVEGVTLGSAAIAGFRRDIVHRRDAFFTVTSTEPIRTVLFRRLNVDVPDGFRGDLNAEVRVTVRDHEGGFIWERTETVEIAEVAADGTTSRAVRAQNIMRGAGNQEIGIIEIEEDTVDSLAFGETIRLIAPDGVTFADPAGLPITNAAWLPREDNNRELRIRVTSPVGSPRHTITLGNSANRLRVNVSPGVADGPVTVEIDNVPGATRARVTRARITVATVGAGAVTVSRQGDLPDAWNLGRLNREIADIRLAEAMEGALEEERTVTLTLPVGYTWNRAPLDPDGAFLGEPIVSDRGRTLTYWTREEPTNSRTDFDLEDGRINARIDATPGDVVVTIGGNAGVSGTAVVATSRRPVTVTVATTPNIRADSLNQVVGNIVITENYAGALRDGSLDVIFPLGVSVVGATVSVSDVAGGEPTARVIRTAERNLEISVSEATAPINPASVTISNIRINAQLLPLVAVGAVTVDIGGDSVLHRDIYDVGLAEDDHIEHAEALGEDIAKGLVVANLVGRQAARTVFTVGQTAFTVDGVSQPALDVAPVIQDGRTMMPLRAAANAAGVTNENIFFEAGVITIIRGDRVVQFTLGSRVMVVNGVAMNMDVAPALIANRTLVPVRWVATALGVPVVWDGVAQTVTVTVN